MFGWFCPELACERNGGNLSYRMKVEEVESIKEELACDQQWQEIGTSVPSLAGEYFLVTGSGKFFRNVELRPEANICIVEIDETGEHYRILLGTDRGRKTDQRTAVPPDEPCSEKRSDRWPPPCDLPCTSGKCDRPDVRTASGRQGIYKRTLGNGNRVSGGIPRRCGCGWLDGTGRS